MVPLHLVLLLHLVHLGDLGNLEVQFLEVLVHPVDLYYLGDHNFLQFLEVLLVLVVLIFQYLLVHLVDQYLEHLVLLLHLEPLGHLVDL